MRCLVLTLIGGLAVVSAADLRLPAGTVCQGTLTTGTIVEVSKNGSCPTFVTLTSARIGDKVVPLHMLVFGNMVPSESSDHVAFRSTHGFYNIASGEQVKIFPEGNLFTHGDAQGVRAVVKGNEELLAQMKREMNAEIERGANAQVLLTYYDRVAKLIKPTLETPIGTPVDFVIAMDVVLANPAPVVPAQ